MHPRIRSRRPRRASACMVFALLFVKELAEFSLITVAFNVERCTPVIGRRLVELEIRVDRLLGRMVSPPFSVALSKTLPSVLALPTLAPEVYQDNQKR